MIGVLKIGRTVGITPQNYGRYIYEREQSNDSRVWFLAIRGDKIKEGLLTITWTLHSDANRWFLPLNARVRIKEVNGQNRYAPLE